MSLPIILLFLIVLTNYRLRTVVAIDDICNKSVVKRIDSAIHSQIEPNIVYLFVNYTVYELNVENMDRASIESVTDLKEWSEQIISPIQYVYTTKADPKYLELTNCNRAVRKDWVIRIPDRKLVTTLSPDTHCLDPSVAYRVDFVAGTDAYPKSFYLDRVFNPKPETYVLNSPGSDIIEIRREIRADTDDYLKLVIWRTGQQTGSTPLTNIKGQFVDAAFIHGSEWFFFAGQHYCRIGLNNHSFTKCETNLISEWITDCANGELKSIKLRNNMDISLYLIILVIIIAFGVIALIVVILFISREVTSKKKGSSGTT